jgi:hypothetical protein
MENKIQTNLKLLQDLKFLIYKFSDYRVNFYDFGILTFRTHGEVLNLDFILHEFKNDHTNDHTIEEIAWSLVKKYQL